MNGVKNKYHQMREDKSESIVETRLRMIKEDLLVLDNRAKRIIEERAQLIIKLAKTREALQNK